MAVSYSLHVSRSDTGKLTVTAKNTGKRKLGTATGPDGREVLLSVLMQVDPQLAVELGADPRTVLDHILRSR